MFGCQRSACMLYIVKSSATPILKRFFKQVLSNEVLQNNFCAKSRHFRSFSQICVPVQYSKAVTLMPNYSQNERSFLHQNRNIYIHKSQKDGQFIQERHQLRKCTQVDNVLLIWESSGRDMKLVPYVINSLKCITCENEAATACLRENPIFSQLGEELQLNLTSLPDWALYNAAELYLQHFEHDEAVVDALLKQIQGLTANFNLGMLMKLENLLKHKCTTAARELTLQELSEEIKSRWNFKINPSSPIIPSDIVKMMSVVSTSKMDYNEKVSQLKQLEDLAFEVHQNLAVYEIVLVMNILAKYSHRHKPLIHALTSKFNQSLNVNLTIKALTNFAYSCAVLSIYDRQVLTKIGKNMQGNLQGIKDHEVKFLPRFLHSISVLRWRDEVLIDSIVETWFQKTDEDEWDEERLKAFHSILNSCAHVQYAPFVLKEYITRPRRYLNHKPYLMKRALDHFKASDPIKQLDIVYSLAIFQLLRQTDVDSILTKLFLQKIEAETKFEAFSKLIAVNSSAALQLFDYEGPMLDPETINKYITEHEKTNIGNNLKERKGFKTLLSILTVMGANQKYVKMHTYTHLGHLIDFDFYVNKSSQIQPYPEEKNNPDIYRVAVKLVEFSDKTLFTDAVIGKLSLDVKQLQELGFCSVLIDVSDLQSLENDVQRVQFFQDKIKASVVKFLNSSKHGTEIVNSNITQDYTRAKNFQIKSLML